MRQRNRSFEEMLMRENPVRHFPSYTNQENGDSNPWLMGENTNSRFPSYMKQRNRTLGKMLMRENPSSRFSSYMKQRNGDLKKMPWSDSRWTFKDTRFLTRVRVPLPYSFSIERLFR